MIMLGINPGRYEVVIPGRRMTLNGLISILVFAVLILSLSPKASGVDLPGTFDVEITNSGGEDGDLGYTGSTFEFTVDRPADVQHDQVVMKIEIDGEADTLEWSSVEDQWIHQFKPTVDGIITWEIIMTDASNSSNSVSKTGQIAVLEDRGISETEQSEHEYHNDPMTYLIFSFIMSFASVSVLAGLFALKYGKKRSKITAVPMILSGVIIWGHWIFFNFILVSTYPDDTVFGIIHWVAAPLLKPIMALLGAVVGAVLAVIVFLTVIVRS